MEGVAKVWLNFVFLSKLVTIVIRVRLVHVLYKIVSWVLHNLKLIEAAGCHCRLLIDLQVRVLIILYKTMFGKIKLSVAAAASHRFRDILHRRILMSLVLSSDKRKEASCHCSRVVVQSIIDGMLTSVGLISGQGVGLMGSWRYWLSFLIFIRGWTGGIHGSFIIKLMRLLKQIVAGSFAFLNPL